ncbi:uncharacterized protein PHALS_05725 [Plasmopara halstedii]|uniref:Uncharacterized protein n=1 Tax=Plasmopara halstedii TaxID=4781 RepID=A0A0P1ABU5_PLAHL|nr:uncharacterized protein PHALS_05725 [Plasmopara halstedii]CEG37665.1 hypothetical protein PHALS_05725 [Plasmopara halstedii]|eukprot:XP_024574034.1 hypothetical protein PHALS_05725 [Plasmopara halstedii]
MTATIPHNSTVTEESYSHINNDTETRTGPGVPFVHEISSGLIDTKLSLEVKIPLEHRLTEWLLPGSGSTRKSEAQTALSEVKTLLKNDNWRSLLKAPSIWWDKLEIRKEIFRHCALTEESPFALFQYMKISLPDFSKDSQRIDRKIPMWFDYITLYRNFPKNLKVHDAETDTGFTICNDQELFSFLVTTYFKTIKTETPSALNTPEKESLDSLQQVVTLFEKLRLKSATQKIAEGMQRYMLSRPDTKELVLKAWLHNGESPEIVPSILQEHGLIGFDDIMLWLRYAKLYYMSVPPSSMKYYLDPNAFLKLLEQKLTIHQLTIVYSTKAFGHLFEEVLPIDVASKIRANWNKFLLDNDMTPVLLPAPVFITKRAPVTSRMICDMLLSTIELDDIVQLARLAMGHSEFKDLAVGMLNYLPFTNFSKNNRMNPKKYWQLFLSQHVTAVVVQQWFRYSEWYFRQRKSNTVQSDVVNLLQDIEPRQEEQVLKALKQLPEAEYLVNYLENQEIPASKKPRNV